MSFYSNVTEQDLINLRKLAEQQKNQRVEKIKKRILKQTHDVKLAESLSPITKNIEKVNKSAKKLGDGIKKSNFEKKIIKRQFLLKSIVIIQRVIIPIIT